MQENIRVALTEFGGFYTFANKETISLETGDISRASFGHPRMPLHLG
jgi:hypothetical protein